MSTFKVAVDGKPAQKMNHAAITALFTDKYPAWAASAITSQLIHDLENDIHDADKDYIEVNTNAENYHIIDMDTAASESGIGEFNTADYGGDDQDTTDMIESWIQDVKDNLHGLVDTIELGLNSEFLLLRS